MARRATQQTYERDLALAWHIANWSGPGKKLPELSSVLRKMKAGAQKQTRDEQQSLFYQIAAQHGLEPRRIRLVKKESA